MTALSPTHVILFSLAMFGIGVVGVLTRRNAILILMSIELILNAANLNFIAFGSPYLRGVDASLGLDGQLLSLFVIVLAAAEAAVALAIALNFYNSFDSIDVDRADCPGRANGSLVELLVSFADPNQRPGHRLPDPHVLVVDRILDAINAAKEKRIIHTFRFLLRELVQQRVTASSAIDVLVLHPLAGKIKCE